MSNQNHIIKKQILEITLKSEENSFQIQNEISRIYRENVVPMINMCCDELCDPDITYRQDKLEIDLGVINIANLETEFTEKTSNKVYQAIEGIVQEKSETPKTTTAPDEPGKSVREKPTGSSFELFNCFFQTGILPWWAGKIGKEEFIKRFDEMLKESPESVNIIMQECLPNKNHMIRLIYQLPDNSLIKLLHTQTPSHSELIGEVVNDVIIVLKQINLKREISDTKTRLQVWQSVLHDIFGSYTSSSEIKHLLHNIISSLTKIQDQTYNDLVSLVIKTVSSLENTGTVFKSKLAEIIDKNGEVNAARDSVKRGGIDNTMKKGEKTVNGSVPPKSITKPTDKLNIKSQNSNEGHSKLLALLTSLKGILRKFELTSDFNKDLDNAKSITNSDLLSEKFKVEIGNLLETLNLFKFRDDVTEIIKGLKVESRAIDKLLQKTQLNIDKIVQVDSELAGTTQMSLFNDLNNLQAHITLLIEKVENFETDKAKAVLENKQLIVKQEEKKQTETSNLSTSNYSQDLFTDSDEIYINNAGIVILWTYLNRFFQTIGLVKENAFINRESAQRGALFLQYLANGETDIGEFDLPLNKILCGIDLEDAIEGQLEVTDKEKQECGNLLGNVIKNWAVLKQTTVDGLRRAFLQREGSISTQDNGWLVRVEHQTHDILLDKLPWPIRVIKLPWMDRVVYVEW